jgi:hypothetical protein
MKAESLSDAFDKLSTALIADAALRLKVPFRISPPGLGPVTPNQRLAGPVLPVRHFGSVDIFLEAMQSARRGDVLVIDNGGRLDEGCIGDLTALEAEHCGLAGIIVWARIAAIGIRLGQEGRRRQRQRSSRFVAVRPNEVAARAPAVCLSGDHRRYGSL